MSTSADRLPPHLSLEALDAAVLAAEPPARTIDGIAYDRVFVCELEPGDALATGETVAAVVRVTDDRTRVDFTDGTTGHYRHGHTTALVARVA